jgi:alginate O-acetyltransferase complex protein AlgI
MVFSSQTFLFLFLPVLIGLYALTPRAGRNAVLLLASLLFYTWGGGWFLGWLLGSIAVNWSLGLLAGRQRDRGRSAAWVMGLATVFNVGVLGWFKYANFFVDTLNAAVTAMDGAPIAWGAVALPIGISFFTFQAMSYVFDVARGDARAMRNPLDFALFIALFPQLIAGPVVRYQEIESQIRERAFRLESVCAGLVRFSHGLCKKVLIADSVAPLADAAFIPGASLSGGDAWLGILAYTIQIYFDFSGYSDMALGLGRIFGFRFPENFDHPYSAASVTEFWRRWHMTLSRWFRDYLYIPLGGSRGSTLLTYRNLVIVFLVTGLWHGANWTFVAWGAYHGFWLVVERIRGRRERPHGLRLIPTRVWTLLVVMIGWVLFRAATIGDAWSYVGAMFGFEPSGGDGSVPLTQMPIDGRAVLALCIGSLSFIAPYWWVIGPRLDDGDGWIIALIRVVVVAVGLPLALLLVATGSFSPFLYFQF